MIIVSGGAGFIGSHTVDELLELRMDVCVIDNFYSGSPENLRGYEKLRILNVDIRDFNSIFEGIKGEVEGIIHLAAIVSLDEARANPKLAFETNFLGTLNMLELARKLDVGRFVYASSVAVYGEPVYLPIDESHPLKPANLYGLSKLMGEQLAMSYMEEYGIDVVALRYFNVYGPRMRSGPYSGVVHIFITSLLRGEPVRIFGDGDQTRDFVYVKDVAKANVKSLFSNVKGAFNVGTGVETSINELLSLISDLLGVRAEVKYESPRKGDVRRSRASAEAIREAIGWTPEVGIREGLKRTIEWYRRSVDVLNG
ncbi:NAD-dependent epimerase/dehydratase family protein [Candidatus Korarchaeum cryptofilum]|uniref:NAD-dependent epimerase/dehydratase n=1 Tax=Korarchaeum cryptofilum (strain OPF8) TaxID=374847 RepID=B1L4Y7_KORCO|nr:NAD-dependent epimerase/dehydratase family protein [Candidatus Korarchaeum cryptofilum]ACB07516.1 NAD-dependent epimerase/dehydratase [Candidatus Korarchaeum cryptofilum OPF8]